MTIKVSVEMGPLNSNQKKWWPPNCAIRKIVVTYFVRNRVYADCRHVLHILVCTYVVELPK